MTPRPARRTQTACVAALVALCVGVPAAARASFVPPTPPEELGAHTLRPGELKVGPTDLRLGLPLSIQLGTRFALNFLGGMNADLKWNLFSTDIVALAIETGVVHFDPEAVGITLDTPFQVTAVPIGARSSFTVIDTLRLHVGLRYLSVKPEGESPDSVKRIQRYMGPVGTLSAGLTVEWRLSEHLAIVTEVDAPLTLLPGELRYTGEDSHGDFVRAALSLMGSFEVFNFRVGVGYGPSFLGEAGVFPVADVYLRIF